MNQLPQQTVKRIEEESDKYADKVSFRVPYDGSNKFYDDNHFKWAKEAYISGATSEAQRNRELVEALKKIDAISFHKNEWEEMAQIQNILKKALKNYKE